MSTPYGSKDYGFFLVGGYLLGGQSGLMLALVVALGMNFFAYWNSDKMVLRMSNAHEVGPNEAPELYGLIARATRDWLTALPGPDQLQERPERDL